MKSYLYISQEQKPFDRKNLHRLVDGASLQNQKNDVTGCLHYTEGFFLQYIEGPEKSITNTISRIKSDPRHTIFYSASNDQLSARCFPDWSMHWEDGGNDGAEINGASDALVTLNNTLDPFKRIAQSPEMNQTFSLYSQIAYDHLLRSLVELKRNNTEMVETLAMSVHDLLAPVRAIFFLTEVIDSDPDEKKVQSVLESVNFIRQSASRMEMIINDLLSHVSDSEDTSSETVAVADTVSEAFKGLKLQYPNAALEVDGELPHLQVSSMGLWRLISCLIENGIKYNCSERPTIRISAELDDGDWRFAITDNGIGIDPQFHSKIFEMFKRLHPKSEYPGTGIGLATCRRIVEGWNGRIWIHSSKGSGSTFYFTCPASG